MYKTVPLCIMTWSNTLVYSCECMFLFVLLFYLVNVFSMCLVFSDVYWYVSYSEATDAEN